eukprot:6262724-Amphidinium_carterae.1
MSLAMLVLHELRGAAVTGAMIIGAAISVLGGLWTLDVDFSIVSGVMECEFAPLFDFEFEREPDLVSVASKGMVSGAASDFSLGGVGIPFNDHPCYETLDFFGDGMASGS